MSDKRQKKPKKKSKNRGIGILLLDKLIIAAIIIAISSFLENRFSENQIRLQASINEKNDSIQDK